MEKVKILKAVDIINDSVSEYEGERPFLSTGDLNLSTITNLELHTFSEKPSRANQNVSSGDLILARMQGTVKVKLINNEDENIIVSTGFLVLRPKINADSKYLFHLLKSSNFQNDKDKLCTGATQKAINNSNFEKLEIPLPSLATQQRIAAILDQADAIIQNNRAIVQKYDALTQSLFLDMFGDPVKNEKGWEMKTLGEIVDFLTSGSRGWAKYYSSEGDIFLRIQNVGYNKLRLDDVCYINTPNTAEAKRTRVIPGDIVLSITADLGRTAVIPENFPNAFINQHLAILRLSQENNPIFVSAFIASYGGQTLFNKLDKGGVKAGLNFTDIKSYNIFCPPIDLQNQFAERVAVIEAQKQQAQEALAKSEALFESLLQKAFKGELN